MPHCNHCVGWATSLPGDWESSSKLTHVAGKIHFLLIVGLRALSSVDCQRLHSAPKGCLKFLAMWTFPVWQLTSFGQQKVFRTSLLARLEFYIVWLNHRSKIPKTLLVFFWLNANQDPVYSPWEGITERCEGGGEDGGSCILKTYGLFSH